MTENFRELQLGHRWIPLEHNSFDEFLSGYEQNMFIAIADIIDKFSQVNFFITRNFTYSYSTNKHILKGRHLSKIWIDTLYENQIIEPYPNETRFVSGIAVNPLNMYILKSKFLQRYGDQYKKFFDAAEKATDLLIKSNLNYKIATKHPTERGHEIYADYLYQEILSKSSIL